MTFRVLIASLFVTIAGIAQQQPALTITGPSSPVIAGGTAVFTIAITGSQGNAIDLLNTISTTPAASIAVESALSSKTHVCALVPPAVSPTVCGIMGLTPAPTVDAAGNVTIPAGTIFDVSPIPDGSVVERVTVTVPASIAPNSTLTLTVSDGFMVDASGNETAIGGSSATVAVTDLRTLAAQAYSAFLHAPTPQHFQALVLAIAALATSH